MLKKTVPCFVIIVVDGVAAAAYSAAVADSAAAAFVAPAAILDLHKLSKLYHELIQLVKLAVVIEFQQVVFKLEIKKDI